MTSIHSPLYISENRNGKYSDNNRWRHIEKRWKLLILAQNAKIWEMGGPISTIYTTIFNLIQRSNHWMQLFWEMETPSFAYFCWLSTFYECLQSHSSRFVSRKVVNLYLFDNYSFSTLHFEKRNGKYSDNNRWRHIEKRRKLLILAQNAKISELGGPISTIYTTIFNLIQRSNHWMQLF